MLAYTRLKGGRVATVQLNVRIDEDLKAAGDAVLERFGTSAVQVVRDVWRYMADYQRIPQFDERAASSDKAAPDDVLLNRVENLSGMALRLAREAGLRSEFEAMSYEQLRESAFEEMLAEMDERHV